MKLLCSIAKDEAYLIVNNWTIALKQFWRHPLDHDGSFRQEICCNSSWGSSEGFNKKDLGINLIVIVILLSYLLEACEFQL